jgi:hypothetical protein
MSICLQVSCDGDLLHVQPADGPVLEGLVPGDQQRVPVPVPGGEPGYPCHSCHHPGGGQVGQETALRIPTLHFRSSAVFLPPVQCCQLTEISAAKLKSGPIKISAAGRNSGRIFLQIFQKLT